MDGKGQMCFNVITRNPSTENSFDGRLPRLEIISQNDLYTPWRQRKTSRRRPARVSLSLRIRSKGPNTDFIIIVIIIDVCVYIRS